MNSKSIQSCELGPIRPPSEHTSLLLRISRNCPWNKCSFCAVYKSKKFSRRSIDELKNEIDFLAKAADKIKKLAKPAIASGINKSQAFFDIINSHYISEEERRVAFWLGHGGKHMFLQDADGLVQPAAKLVPVLNHIKSRFPDIDRITSYARSRTLFAKTKSQLIQLKDAGLTRIHVGLESGDEQVLKLIEKGCKPIHHVEGCKKAINAGFEVCCYVMPGLGGKNLSKQHAISTAKVLKQIEPHHIRLRTLWIDRGSPLYDMQKNGVFQMLKEDEIVLEIYEMIKLLKGANSMLISDHDRNLLMNLEGHVTKDAARLEQICAHFLNLSNKRKDAFIMTRRGRLK